MRINKLFKAIIGVVSSVVAVGCSHVKEEEVRCYYGPAPTPEVQEPKPSPAASDEGREQENVEPAPLPKVEEEPTKIYGPPEAL